MLQSPLFDRVTTAETGRRAGFSDASHFAKALRARADRSAFIEESAMLEGYHFQNAYVTRDVDKWVEAFRQRAKVDRVLTYEGSTPVTTLQGAGTQTNKLAFIWVGDLQYELIQPVSGSVRIYSDALPAGDGLQFHHVCMRVADWDEFRGRVDTQPYPVVLEGGNEKLRFLYLDARPFLGHYLEYTWMTDERWTQIGGQPASRTVT